MLESLYFSDSKNVTEISEVGSYWLWIIWQSLASHTGRKSGEDGVQGNSAPDKKGNWADVKLWHSMTFNQQLLIQN